MPSGLTQDKVKALKDCFKAFDKDNNGYITREELGQALRQTSIEMPGEELDEMINAVDKNNDGKIGLDEFVNELGKKVMEPRPKDEVEAAFRLFDSDNSGLIDESELYLAVQRLNPNVTKANVNTMLKKIDTDRSGKISLEGLII